MLCLYTPHTSACDAQMNKQAREALLRALAAMTGVLVGTATDVDGVAAPQDDGDELASDTMQAYQPGTLSHRALATWALLHAPDVPWGGLAAHVRDARVCRCTQHTRSPLRVRACVRAACRHRATLSLPPTWPCGGWQG